jgi:nucleotide-binding universal stress UspA family protein
MHIMKILVAVDFSPSSDAALELALAGADPEAVEIVVVHVVDPKNAGGWLAKAKALTECIERVRTPYAASMSGRLEVGARPEDAILELLEREGFDVVVLGGPRGSKNVGTVVAEKATCKVITVVDDGVSWPVTVSWNHAHSTPRSSRPVPKNSPLDATSEASDDLAESDIARAC